MKTAINVIFKETYMICPVKRTCFNMTKSQVIQMYNLNGSDIEWYKFEED